IDSALKNPTILKYVDGWLAERPVTKLDFQDNLNVHVVMSADTNEFADGLRDAVSKSGLQIDNFDDAWKRIKQDLAEKAKPVEDDSLAVSSGDVGAVNNAQMPQQPPDWVYRWIDAEGEASDRGGKLQTARAAEAVAQLKLRAQIDALEISPGTTVQQVA